MDEDPTTECEQCPAGFTSAHDSASVSCKVECTAEQRPDCNGLCTNVAWVGDGFCDDPYEGHHLNCADLDFDGGDCTVVDADDEFAVDCLGHRAPLSWVGDGACDNGVYEHNGKWINFNCAEAGWDGGDCAQTTLTHMECVNLVRDLDHCEAVDGVYQCETDNCVQAIEALAAGWDECNSLLGLTQDILAEFQLVCGACSPLPIFDLCGLGSNFPTSSTSCNVPHCAITFVPWYEENFAVCESDLRGFGATDADIPALTDFYNTCLAVDTSAPAGPVCDPIFLGPDIGFQNVFEYHDEDGSCQLSMAELATVCSVHYEQCLAFLTGEQERPQCEQVYLGPEIGFVNIMVYNDADGSCEISMQELQAVCSGALFQTCLDFLNSADQTPQCESIYLGPDIGFVNVMLYNDADGTCTLSMEELAAVCANFFAECIAFLDSNDQTDDQAPDPAVYFTAAGWFLMTADANVVNIGTDEQVAFVSVLRNDVASALGIDIDMVSVTEINAAPNDRVQVRVEMTAPDTEEAALQLLRRLIDQSADDTSALLRGVVTNTVEQVAETEDELQLHTCEPVFLGPDIGFVNVMEYHDEDGTCTVSMAELANTCSIFFAECIAFLQSSEEPDGVPPPEPEPEPEGGCVNEYDRIHGAGQCAALLTGDYTCEVQFCKSCRYAGYCDFSCDFCAPPEPEPEPEPEPAQGCDDSEVADCFGKCTNVAWVGDGFCDDPYEGHHLNCADLDFDGGDCTVVDADDEFAVDCLGHRAPLSWVGDGACDNGVYEHNGKWINFNCAEAGFDGGDCPGGLSHMECLNLIRDLDHCEAEGGGNDCAADPCVQAIEALASGWNQCETLLGLSRNILREFQLVCGACSPYPILEICGTSPATNSHPSHLLSL